MNISLEEKKIEAVKRMKLMGTFPETIRQFEDDGLVSVSEPPLGGFFWVDETDKKLIEEFERKNDALVYMVIRSYTNFGQIDSYLFVCDYKEDWNLDRRDIIDKVPTVYALNRDDEMLSDMGSIGIKRTPAAGFIRTF